MHIFLGGDTRNFGEKISNKEIEYEKKKRDLPILAGDLALVFYDHFEESLNNEKNYLKYIRQDFESEIKKYEFLEEDYNDDRFFNAIGNLERNFRLINQFGPKWKDSESLTKWRIINPQRLEEFVQKKSINIILRRVV